MENEKSDSIKKQWGGARAGGGRKKQNMHHLSFRVKDSDFQDLEKIRGEKARNSYLREVLLDHIRLVKKLKGF